MQVLIDNIREKIKHSNNRSEKIRNLSQKLLSLRLNITDLDESEICQQLSTCVYYYHDSNQSTMLGLIENGKLDSESSRLISNLLTNENSNTILYIIILLLSINQSPDRDYSKEIIVEKAFDKLSSQCYFVNKILTEYKDTRYFDQLSIEDRSNIGEILKTNNCETHNYDREFLCDQCKVNFPIVRDHLERNDLETLVANWD